MEAPSRFSVFGSYGFIGSEICKDYRFEHNEPNKTEKRHYPSKYRNLVYLISTVDNYSVKDGNPYIDIQTNLTHLMNVLQANRLKFGKDFTITFVSSWFVYGKSNCPAKEDAPCNPTGFYSITKRTAEQLLISYCETFGIKWRIVRLSNVLGAEDKKVSPKKNALQYMIRELCEGREVSLYEGGVRRDYLHVSDVAEAIRLVVENGKFGEIYNIGSGKGTSIEEVILYVAGSLGRQKLVKYKPVPEFHKLVQVKDMWLDTKKIYTHLGWKPKKQLYEVIQEILDYYHKEENG